MVLIAVIHLVHLHGPAQDYVGLALLALLSGIGLYGFGEVAVISAGIYAAHHELDIMPVVICAWLGALAGGQIGWVVGVHGLRRLLNAPGPLLKIRQNLLHHSDRIYRRHHTLAVLVTPSWTAGLHRTAWRHFFFLSALATLLWAGALAEGAFWIGSSLTNNIADDIGIALGVLIALVVVYYLVRHYLRMRLNAEE